MRDYHQHKQNWLLTSLKRFLLSFLILSGTLLLIPTNFNVVQAINLIPMMLGMVGPLLVATSAAIAVISIAGSYLLHRIACLETQKQSDRIKSQLPYSVDEQETFNLGVKAGNSNIGYFLSWFESKSYLHYGTFLTGKHLSENQNAALIQDLNDTSLQDKPSLKAKPL